MNNEKICSNCGTSLTEIYKFCPRCGKQILHQMDNQQSTQMYAQQPNQQHNQSYSCQVAQNYVKYNYVRFCLDDKKIRYDSMASGLNVFLLIGFFALISLGVGIALLMDEPEVAPPFFIAFVLCIAYGVYRAYNVIKLMKCSYSIYLVPCINRSIEDDGEATFFVIHLKDPCSSTHQLIYPVDMEFFRKTVIGEQFYLVIFDDYTLGKKIYDVKAYYLSPELQAKLKIID